MKYEIPFGSQFYFSSEGSPNTWKLLTNNPSLNRAEHSIACDKDNKRVWLFGGKDSTGSYYSDLWYYDVSASSWTQQSVFIFSSATRTITLWDRTTSSINISQISDLQEHDTINPYV